jgi:hypothetical protein
MRSRLSVQGTRVLVVVRTLLDLTATPRLDVAVLVRSGPCQLRLFPVKG